MRDLTILLDVDGFLADFLGPFLEHANRVTGRNVRSDEITQWDILHAFSSDAHEVILKAAYQPGFCTSLPVLPGAKEGVAALRDFGQVLAVTSPWASETWCFERTQWLRNELGFDKHDVLHVPGERKYLVHGDVFVDDKLETVIAWSEAHPEGLALLWNAPYNQGTMTSRSFRVFGWDALLHTVRNFKGVQPFTCNNP